MSPHHHTQPLPAARPHTHHLPRPMSRRVRNVVIYGSAALWFSGMIWMVLHYFFKTANEFGMTRNASEPFTLRIHGMLAMLMLFMFGWIGGTHVAIRWRQWRANVDGLVLLIVAALLAISGYALYYLIDDSQHLAVSLIHQALGALIIAIAIIHWRTAAKRR